MYCKNCGKTLNPGDRFCSYCGEKVEIPAEPKVEKPEVTPVTEKKDAPAPKKTFHMDEFNWDLDGYPTDNRKTEDVDFNWASVVEEKQRRAFAPRVTAEPKRPEPAAEVPAEKPAEPQVEKTLEEELFADMGTLSADEPTRLVTKSDTGRSEKVDKFYTFNKKNEELQALLEQEYERIKNGQRFSIDEDDEEAKTEEPAEVNEPVKTPLSRHTEFDWDMPVESVMPAATAEEPEEAPEPVVLAEPEYICTFWSQPAAGYLAPGLLETEEEAAEAEESEETAETVSDASKADAAEEVQTETEPAEQEVCPPCKEETTEDKTKLAFNDVFGNDDDDDNGEEQKKKGKGLKVLAVILCILVVIELCIIGIQYFAPDSAAGKMINDGYKYVLELFAGDAEEAEPEAEPQSDVSEVADIIDAHALENKNIGTIEEDLELVFKDGEDYGFEDFANSYNFENKPWYTDEDENTVTYGDEIIKTLIQYYSSWVDYINNEDEQVLEYIDNTSDFYSEIQAAVAEDGVEYGINRLAIGEIRAGSSGFYVLTSVTTANSGEDKDTTEEQIVYMEPDQKTMKIVAIK